MLAVHEFKYRVVYEQLSRFSGHLSQATTLEAINQCLHRHLKYLFDYQLVRFCFYQQQEYIVHSLSLSDTTWQAGDERLLCAYERQLRGNPIPVIVAEASEQVRSVDVLPAVAKPVQLWHWDLPLGADSGVVASVFSTETEPFQTADVTVLKIVLENLYAKILSIRLIDELSSSKQAVDRALASLQHKNAMISRLVATQEAVIRQRTHALELKNAQLIELSRQHAHTIREPLSRILSLTYLIDVLPVEAVMSDILPALVTTSSDLDKALQQVVRQIDDQLHLPD